MASDRIWLSSGRAWEGYINWHSVPNTAKNTSTVYAEIITYKTDGLPTSGGSYFSGSLYVGSQSVEISYDQENPSETWRAAVSAEISHNQDGNGSCYIGASITKGSGGSTSLDGATLSGGSQVTLDRITRVSTISSARNVTLGEACGVTWEPQSATLCYKLTFLLNEWQYTTPMISPNTTSVFTYSSYDIPLEVAEQMTKSMSASMQVTLYTYQNSTASTPTGNSTKSFTVTVPKSMAPTLSNVSVSINNDEYPVLNSWGVGLAGFSRIKITADATGYYGASVKNFTISGATYNASCTGTSLDYTGDKISTPGTKFFFITCTDSRGMTSTQYSTDNANDRIDILPYTPPNLISMNTEKEEYGDSDASNDRMVVTAEWEYDTVQNHNTANGVVYYKLSSATDWTLHSGVVKNGVPFTLTDLPLDDSKSYNFKVVVTDALGGTSDKSAFASTTQVLLDFRAGGKGLGVGKICETDGMEVQMPTTFYNEVSLLQDDRVVTLAEYITSLVPTRAQIVDMMYPVGSYYISENEQRPEVILGSGTWEQIYDKFLLAASADGGKYVLGAEGGESEHKLSVAELPRHNHFQREYYHAGGSDYYWTHNVDLELVPTTATIDTSYTGSDQAHNNMPPYRVVNIWRRTK